MTLVIDDVTVDFRGRPKVLDGLSLTIERGELVTVWGVRRSGRTTLLRVAAGLLRPTTGTVSIEGRRVRRRSLDVGWCDPTLSTWQRSTIVEHVAVPLLPRGVAKPQAIDMAHAALRRVGLDGVGKRYPRDLDPAELVRAGIARAIVARPRVLVADQPTYALGVLEADATIETLRSIADEGVAVLVTAGDGYDGGPAGGRTLCISAGVLSGEPTPPQAPVVPIR